MILSLIAEATECDFKSKLESDKPVSWLKSVSAFDSIATEYKKDDYSFTLLNATTFKDPDYALSRLTTFHLGLPTSKAS
jgi:hypothetical protein